MGKVEAFSLPGIYCWFYSDDHRPPHFHAKKSGEWQVKVNFLVAEGLMLECEWSKKKIAGKHRRALIKLAVENRAVLLAEWEQKVDTDDEDAREN